MADENRQKITYALMAVCALLLVFYGLNIYATISRTVALEKVSTETKVVEDSLRTLDAQYIALSGKITPEMAKSYGLKEVPVYAFINRSATLGVAINQSNI